MTKDTGDLLRNGHDLSLCHDLGCDVYAAELMPSVPDSFGFFFDDATAL
jgi:hypothetical protein